MSAPEIRGLIHFVIAFFNLFFAFLLWIKGKNKAALHLGWVAFFSAIYSFAFGDRWNLKLDKAF
jgi:hypothetical protein